VVAQGFASTSRPSTRVAAVTGPVTTAESGTSVFDAQRVCGDGAPCADVRIRSASRLDRKQHSPSLRRVAGRPVKGAESGKRQVHARILVRAARAQSRSRRNTRSSEAGGRIRGIGHAERQRADGNQKQRRYESVHDGARCTSTDRTRPSLPHRFNHVPTTVFGTGSRQIENQDGAAVLGAARSTDSWADCSAVSSGIPRRAGSAHPGVSTTPRRMSHGAGEAALAVLPGWEQRSAIQMR